jgi:uncharacterized protein (TIGR00290 family)
MVTEDKRWSWSHGLSAGLLQVQAKALGIPLIQQRTTSKSYEVEFKNVLSRFTAEGVTAGVFGDIDLEEHRQWIERVCLAGGVRPCLPLWGKSQEEILEEFIHSGFEAVVVAAKADLLGEGWLGRRIDADFLEDLRHLVQTGRVTPCGEAGEYHTFVIDGPLFSERIELVETSTELKDSHRFLKIAKYQLRPKSKTL